MLGTCATPTSETFITETSKEACGEVLQQELRVARLHFRAHEAPSLHPHILLLFAGRQKLSIMLVVDETTKERTY